MSSIPFTIITSVTLVTSCIKLLFLNSYHSTDFEVHRNWLAVTSSLPLSKWYTESTSQWTLDYPPFFAWFEYFLSYIAYYFDWKMLVVKNLDYKSEKTILFQRLSVIGADLFLIYAVFTFCKKVQTGKSSKTNYSDKSLEWWFVICAVVLNAGLIMVDHIHFQYNGFLFAFLILSIAHMVEQQYLHSAFWFMLLLNLKHIFLYIAPIYFVYLFRNYCFHHQKDPNKGISSLLGVNILDVNILNLSKLAFIVISIFGISLGPFIYIGQGVQLLSRLFPVSRGLCHAYWAANFWSLYNIMDKILCIAGKKTGFLNSNVTVASMTGGMVAEQNFSVLMDIKPLHTAIITIVAMLPALLKIWYNPRNHQLFVPGLVLCAYSSFLFGYHVHEKAILMVIIPLTLSAWRNTHHARVYIILQTIGHYALFPLLHESAETLSKILIFGIFTIVSLHMLRKIHASSRISSFGIPLIKWYEAIYLYGIIPLYLFTDGIYPHLNINKQYPFIPLLITSVYCAIGVIWSWVILYVDFLQMKCHKLKYQ